MGPPPFSGGNASLTTRATVSCPTLQWGRRLSAAEMSERGCLHLPLTGFNGAAAFQRRKSGPGTGAVPSVPCFNGAAAFQRRKFDQLALRRREHHAASMGPPPFSGGNFALPSRLPNWRSAASMGPPPFSGGNADGAQTSPEPSA